MSSFRGAPVRQDEKTCSFGDEEKCKLTSLGKKTLGKGKIPEKKEERAEKDEQPSIVNKNFKKVPEI